MVLKDFSEEVTSVLRPEGYKEVRHMKSQGRDSTKDLTVSVKTLREKVKLDRLERWVGSILR